MNTSRISSAALWAGALGATLLLGGCTINASDDSDEGYRYRADDDDGWEVRRPATDARRPGPGGPPPYRGGEMGLEGRSVAVHLREPGGVPIEGTFRGREGEWLRLERADGSMLYIAREHVRMIETRGPATAPQP